MKFFIDINDVKIQHILKFQSLNFLQIDNNTMKIRYNCDYVEETPTIKYGG